MTDLVERWDAQQERYLPHREERFELMLDLVEPGSGRGAPRLLDLCCGTDSTADEVWRHHADAILVALR